MRFLDKIKNIRARKENTEYGFTLIELLVVILIIGVLASIAIPAFFNQRERANQASAKSDIRQIEQAITVARVNTGLTTREITGSGYTVGPCLGNQNLEALPQSHSCWVHYNRAMLRISEASGMDVTGLTDPYGRPYSLDENEGENGNCNKDSIGYFKNPLPASGSHVSYVVRVSLSSSACTGG